MKPNFRLENIRGEERAKSPETLSTLNIEYITVNQPRCDCPSMNHCYGCDSAEPKPIQRDLYPVKAA